MQPKNYLLFSPKPLRLLNSLWLTGTARCVVFVTKAQATEQPGGKLTFTVAEGSGPDWSFLFGGRLPQVAT
jgi:hypothetical protein